MKKQIGTSLVKHEDKFYIITIDKNVYEVNELGARIYDLCNGLNDTSVICDKLSKVFDVDKELLKRDIESYIKELKEIELLLD